jgi:hypothetical protein
MLGLPLSGQPERAASTTDGQLNIHFWCALAPPLIATIDRSSHREVESGLNPMAVIGSRQL